MIEAVFISDLHLHPDDKEIVKRFEAFIVWAADHVRALYILGDFFHAWPGDDAIDAWSAAIASRLKWLRDQQVAIYYMHGNRDFLLGKRFALEAGFEIINEPFVITLGGERVLLAHGDRYCTRDKGHQRFRRLTRNRLFCALFLRLPLDVRQKIVNRVRRQSLANNPYKSQQDMDVVPEAMIHHLCALKARTLIHGHTHKPGHITHAYHDVSYQQYVLSDWDDSPEVLCYDNAKGFYFRLISGG